MLQLIQRFPSLASVARVELGRFPTPVVKLGEVAPMLWIKRDDLCGDPLGGNKVRALEFLLAGVNKGDTVVTVGSAGSTHALAVATYGARLGARVLVGRWRQEMNDTASVVAERIPRFAKQAPVFGSPVGAYAWAWTQYARGARLIPAGGSSPLGVLGHVNAGLELIDQIDRGLMPQPATVVVPLGTGGTAAGLALAFAIAGRPITVVAARVVSRIVARRSRVLGLAKRTAALIERFGGQRPPNVAADRLVVVHETYGGAYGRETSAARAAADRLRSTNDLSLDATYSAKAFAHALTLGSGEATLFWLTFDPRILRRS